ncbi:hypothetical protein BHE74_00017678 [Ensete ventricosum]|nr:hypothetical protein BHE74_00017678 [Ensete ventricosum]RZS25068.1 hypothetical protein BHM03_00058221 [Ensete ventricosum]
MKDLCGTKVRKDDVGYYALYMSDLAQQDPDKEMRARSKNLKNSSKVWRYHAAAEEFERGLLHPQLARELYTLLSEVLLARAAKEVVLELNEVRGNLSKVRNQLKEARVRAQKANDDMLKSVKDLQSTRAKLPKRAVDDYKESADFKKGLKRMGRVAYEYDYRVVLARFRSSHPDSEVEEDPFTVRPENDSMPMERQQTSLR